MAFVVNRMDSENKSKVIVLFAVDVHDNGTPESKDAARKRDVRRPVSQSQSLFSSQFLSQHTQKC